MKTSTTIITKDLIVQRNLTEDKYKNIVGIFAVRWEIEP